jgi:RimJ/RimL family protein N-acetyltransferase
MTSTVNELGQPIGFPVINWKIPLRPPREIMVGRFSRVEPISVEEHASDLFEAYSADAENRIWTYLPYGPFATFDLYRTWMERTCLGDDPLLYAIIDAKTGKSSGTAGYLRIDPKNGVIEVGHVNYSPALQRSPAATEAMYLMMKHVFELGYRRYEWKCDALNQKSRRAARRLGFSYEGIFRQAVLHKGRNRDTAWFSVIDQEWPVLKKAYEQWLDPSNFNGTGQQKVRLSDLTAQVVKPDGQSVE